MTLKLQKKNTLNQMASLLFLNFILNLCVNHFPYSFFGNHVFTISTTNITTNFLGVNKLCLAASSYTPTFLCVIGFTVNVNTNSVFKLDWANNHFPLYKGQGKRDRASYHEVFSNINIIALLKSHSVATNHRK